MSLASKRKFNFKDPYIKLGTKCEVTPISFRDGAAIYFTVTYDGFYWIGSYINDSGAVIAVAARFYTTDTIMDSMSGARYELVKVLDEIDTSFAVVKERLKNSGLNNYYAGCMSSTRKTIDQFLLKEENSIFDKEDCTKVCLYDEYTNVIDKENVVYISSPGGYFKKDDPRIVFDYFTRSTCYLNDPKYSSSILPVYTECGTSGFKTTNLYTKKQYTDPKYGPTPTCLPMIVMKNHNSAFISMELLDSELLKKKYTESIGDGRFYHNSALSALGVVEGKHLKNYYRKSRQLNDFAEDTKNLPITFVNTFGKKYSFGVEIETISGYLPTYLDTKLYYSAVHDGSLKQDDGKVYGGEYVTCVLIGDIGLKQLKQLCYELTKRCLVNKKCGVHIHLGGINFTQENIALMYWLYQRVQKEIFSTLPLSRRENEYCRVLDQVSIELEDIKKGGVGLEKIYSDIVLVMSKTEYNSNRVNKREDHPRGHKCAYDHNTARYCWVNFVPAMFNTRRNGVYTIEFRHISATTSYTKIKNWLLICFALVDIVENHKQEIYAGDVSDLTDIVRICYPKNYHKIADFIDRRKEKFISHSESIGTVVENEEYSEEEIDNNFSLRSL